MRYCIGLLLLCAACSSEQAPAADAVQATWDIDEGENLAVPMCGKCGDVLDRSKKACTECDTPFAIPEKTIDCPECKGSKACAHCGEKGTWCPLCEGAPDCAECAAAPDKGACERCGGSHECANCGNSGKIVLR